jgi:para-aminobenzoate synthetase component 1
MRLFIGEKNQVFAFKQKIYQYLRNYKDDFVLLDSHAYSDFPYARYDLLLGIRLKRYIFPVAPQGNFDELESALHEFSNQWKFGFLSYDLKNAVENLESAQPDYLDFPDFAFVIPEIVINIDTNGYLECTGENATEIFQIIQEQVFEESELVLPSVSFENRITFETYEKRIQQIKEHIRLGDIYEINFCQEFFAEQIFLENNFQLFEKLCQLNPSPFSAFLRLGDWEVISASPERFLTKQGEKLISQPIKGTLPRGRDKEEDQLFSQMLLNSEKDRAEHVMIVDLVRNDLTFYAEVGSIQVEELFGIYSFPQVIQMISTITAQLTDKNLGFAALQKAFPMGSMTGAPKIRAMELIDQMESQKRSIFSGALGYINPDGDFDFNVLIRSFYYNQKRKYLSYSTGGAIVYDSSVEDEYQESLLKAKVIENLFGRK